MSEMPERKTNSVERVGKGPYSAENEYVAETLPRVQGMDFGSGPMDEEKLRNEFRKTEETVHSIETEHLLSLRSELTPLVLNYKSAAIRAMEQKIFNKMRFIEPHLSSNLDRLVEIIESNEKGNVDTLLRDNAPHELVKDFSDEEFDELVTMVRHIARNAEDVSDTNLIKGGSQVERDLDRLFTERLEMSPLFGERARAKFLQSLGLKRSPQVLYGAIHNDILELKYSFGNFALLPIGEYGEAFARDLFKAMQLMNACTLLVKEQAQSIATSHRDVFQQTARGRDSIENGAWFALQEGVLSLFQTLSLCTAEKVEGYDNPEQLLRDVITAELPNQLAYLAPAATIGPLSLMGKYIVHLVQKTERGLIINPEAKHAMLIRKKEEHDRKTLEYIHLRENQSLELPALARGCPVAFESDELRTTGIKELSGLFLTMFEKAKQPKFSDTFPEIEPNS